jgi:hypothetical protein
MKTYKAYLNQGGGCDYTIGCGQTVIDIKANSMEEAKVKLIKEIQEEYSHEERQLDSAELYEIENIISIDCKELYIAIDEAREKKIAKEQEEREKQDYIRLQAKFGNVKKS